MWLPTPQGDTTFLILFPGGNQANLFRPASPDPRSANVIRDGVSPVSDGLSPLWLHRAYFWRFQYLYPGWGQVSVEDSPKAVCTLGWISWEHFLALPGISFILNFSSRSHLWEFYFWAFVLLLPYSSPLWHPSGSTSTLNVDNLCLPSCFLSLQVFTSHPWIFPYILHSLIFVLMASTPKILALFSLSPSAYVAMYYA